MPSHQETDQESNTEIPERLGIYRVESLLGRGGMGDVYLAWDEVLERHVALKRIRSDRLGNTVQQARFLREAKAVARLDHPAIVRIHHVLQDDESSSLVMEFVRGRDLSRLPLGNLPVRRVLTLALGVADGLEAAHAQGLVHRDLKPSNVMSTAQGGVKILDFGLALTRDEALREPSEDAEGRLTGSGVLVGTAYAMSPEQILRGSVDHRSDLFAFGSLLYQMLAGRPPFQGRSVIDTLHRVMKTELVPLEVEVPDLPEPLVRLVAELLAKDRDDRPPSAGAVSERLTEILQSLPPQPGDRTASRPTEGPADADSPTSMSPPLGAFDVQRSDTPRQISTADAGPVVRALLGLGWSEGVPGRWRAQVPEFLVEEARRFDGRVLAPGDVVAAGDVVVLLFRRPAEAVAFALALHERLADQTMRGQEAASARIGIHLGEVSPQTSGGTGKGPGREAESIQSEALRVTSSLVELARDGQTLLGRAAFDLARGALAPASLAEADVRWMAHGRYLMAGRDEPFEVFEVGRSSLAPLSRPEDRAGLRRSVGASEELALGWRPATGQPVPRKPEWRLQERLGEGGFGEVWLARRVATPADGTGAASGDGTGDSEERVFKFCFEPERLRALKREVTIFRLLRETLGHRDDIARVLDWDFDEVPYYLESEYTVGGDLARWAERQGGLASVPLKIRLELVAEVAEALAAAHSVGVLHKDVKPHNVLVGPRDDGRPQARLTDFGVGVLTERDRLDQPGFTVLGFTETSLDDDSSSGGTVQYMAPERLAGQPATIAADVYSLGVLLYQCVVGDLERPLAVGWHRQIDDELLEEDVASCVDGDPERRPRGAGEVAERLRTLEQRRAERRAERDAEAARRRKRRRRELAARLGGVAAVLLVLISVFAYQTVRAREQADARRQQAETLIDFLLGDLRQELQPIGQLDILGKVGDQAMEYFAAVPESELSPDELANYAKALHQIGQVRFSLGRVSEAAEAFQRSLDMAKELAAGAPQNADWQFELGQSHFWAGFLRWQERDLDAALHHFEAYREISEGLVERDPDSAEWRLELAYSHSNVGQVHQQQGDLGDATIQLEASVQVLEGLIADGDPEHKLAAELAHLYNKLGKVAESRGRLEEALSRYELGLELMQRASHADPDDVELLRFVGHCHTYVIEMLRALGRLEDALEYAEADLVIAEKVASRDPQNLIWREELARRHNRLARIYRIAGLRDAARSQIEAAIGLTRQLAEQAPDHSAVRLSRALNHWVEAKFALADGRVDEAVDDAGVALELLQQLETEQPRKLYRRLLAEVGLLVAEVHEDAGDEKAARAYRESARLQAALLVEQERSPRNLALLVRLLLGLDLPFEAEKLITELEQAGYREHEYLRALASNSRPAA